MKSMCFMLAGTSLIALGFIHLASAADTWKKERWTVEPFTQAMGGGPVSGPVQGAGSGVKSMCQDKEGRFFIVIGQRIDIVTKAGIRWPLAGTGALGFQDGPAETATFRMGVRAYYGYSNIQVDHRGNVFVPDSGNQRVRRIYKDKNGKWMVETWAGGGKTKLKRGQSCSAREASFIGTLQTAVRPDGSVVLGSTGTCYEISADGKSIKCLGPWPDSIRTPKGKWNKMNMCGAGCDAAGNAYFGARTPDVVCRVAPDGMITHVAGKVFSSRGEGWKVGDGAPLEVFFDTPSSTYVSKREPILYMCGGDEYDIRRVPTDMKSTTSTLLKNGRWYVMNIHPNKNRGPAEFDPSATGKPKTEGGKLTDFMCAPLVGIDLEGDLYGKLNRWTGMTQTVKGQGPLPCRVFKIRRIEGRPAGGTR